MQTKMFKTRQKRWFTDFLFETGNDKYNYYKVKWAEVLLELVHVEQKALWQLRQDFPFLKCRSHKWQNCGCEVQTEV